MPYLFTPPAIERPVGTDPLWSRFHFRVGQALLKKDGFYTLSEVVTDEDFAEADIGYLGGHTYLVSNQEAADLTAAGYADFLTIPPVRSGYGVGKYGAGKYGEGDPNSAAATGAYGDGIYGDGTYGG